MKALIAGLFITFAIAQPADAGTIEDPKAWLGDACSTAVSDKAKAAEMIISGIDFGPNQSKANLKSRQVAFKATFEKAEKFYGKLSGCSFGHETSIGDDVKKIVVVAKYGLLPALLEGYFVRGPNGWKSFGVSFIDKKEAYPFK